MIATTGSNIMPRDTQNTATLVRGPKPGKKYFSLSEANRSLPYVSRVIEDLTACYGRVVDFRRRIESPSTRENREHLEAEYETEMDRLSELVDELQQVGVELKDFEKGLLDFPALHDGREIYLCWHRGEDKVCSWHEVDAGYAGRQDVAVLTTN
jgi:hypothetical protein